MFAGRHPAIAADEVDVVRAVHQELSKDGVVVLGLGDMAIGALPRRPLAAHRVRHVAAEGDTAEALAGNRLLLHVDRLAVAVVGADVDGTR